MRHNVKQNTVDRLKQILTGFNEECGTNCIKSGKKQDLIDRVIREMEAWRRTNATDKWTKARNILNTVRSYGTYVIQYALVSLVSLGFPRATIYLSVGMTDPPEFPFLDIHPREQRANCTPRLPLPMDSIPLVLVPPFISPPAPPPSRDTTLIPRQRHKDRLCLRTLGLRLQLPRTLVSSPPVARSVAHELTRVASYSFQTISFLPCGKVGLKCGRMSWYVRERSACNGRGSNRIHR